jgi:hypothetical protein
MIWTYQNNSNSKVVENILMHLESKFQTGFSNKTKVTAKINNFQKYGNFKKRI